MLDESPSLEAVIGMDRSATAAAVARIYDGPHAEQRLEIVARRLADNWSAPWRSNVVGPPLNDSLIGVLDSACDVASSGGSAVSASHIAEALVSTGPWSLAEWLGLAAT